MITLQNKLKEMERSQVQKFHFSPDNEWEKNKELSTDYKSPNPPKQYHDRVTCLVKQRKIKITVLMLARFIHHPCQSKIRKKKKGMSSKSWILQIFHLSISKVKQKSIHWLHHHQHHILSRRKEKESSLMHLIVGNNMTFG